MTKRIKSCFVLALIFSVNAACAEFTSSQESQLVFLSTEQLETQREELDGKKVRIIGYLSSELKIDGLNDTKWEFYSAYPALGEDGKLECRVNFIVAPGADPILIRGKNLKKHNLKISPGTLRQVTVQGVYHNKNETFQDFVVLHRFSHSLSEVQVIKASETICNL